MHDPSDERNELRSDGARTRVVFTISTLLSSASVDAEAKTSSPSSRSCGNDSKGRDMAAKGAEDGDGLTGSRE
jgi:hypothetical protein